MKARSAWPLGALSLAAGAIFAAYLAAGRGLVDFQGYALGRDFINVWTAGHLVRAGRIAAVFDPPSFLAAARRLFGHGLSFHFWSYPPATLLMVAPLGWTSYAEGLAGWTLLGLILLAAALRSFERQNTSGGDALVWMVTLAPATLTNIALGQNGAFSAAAMIAGVTLLDRRPWIAGALLGLLVLKPQLAVLLPVVVLTGRRWRVMGGAAASATALIALSLLLYGPGAWIAFAAQTLPVQSRMLEYGRGPFQTMMPSAYMAARVLGWRWTWALAAQVPFTVVAVTLVWRAWRRPDVEASLRAGLLMAATFVASPQAFNYDLIPTALAAALLWRRDPSATGAAIALCAWALPFVTATSVLRNVQHVLRLAPIGPLVLAALTLRLAQITLRRRASETAGAQGAAQPPSRADRASTAAQPASNT